MKIKKRTCIILANIFAILGVIMSSLAFLVDCGLLAIDMSANIVFIVGIAFILFAMAIAIVTLKLFGIQK